MGGVAMLRLAVPARSPWGDGRTGRCAGGARYPSGDRRGFAPQQTYRASTLAKHSARRRARSLRVARARGCRLTHPPRSRWHRRWFRSIREPSPGADHDIPVLCRCRQHGKSRRARCRRWDPRRRHPPVGTSRSIVTVWMMGDRRHVGPTGSADSPWGLRRSDQASLGGTSARGSDR